MAGAPANGAAIVRAAMTGAATLGFIRPALSIRFLGCTSMDGIAFTDTGTSIFRAEIIGAATGRLETVSPALSIRPLVRNSTVGAAIVGVVRTGAITVGVAIVRVVKAMAWLLIILPLGPSMTVLSSGGATRGLAINPLEVTPVFTIFLLSTIIPDGPSRTVRPRSGVPSMRVEIIPVDRPILWLSMMVPEGPSRIVWPRAGTASPVGAIRPERRTPALDIVKKAQRTTYKLKINKGNINNNIRC